MPTYEYTCRDCGHTFEIVQSMLDESLTMCPECGGSLRKVFAAPAISFKGSGFYATDHGKKSSNQGESKDAGEKSGQKSGETREKTGQKSGETREKTAAEGKESKGSKDSSKGGSSETSSKPSKKEPAAS